MIERLAVYAECFILPCDLAVVHFNTQQSYMFTRMSDTTRLSKSKQAGGRTGRQANCLMQDSFAETPALEVQVPQ